MKTSHSIHNSIFFLLLAFVCLFATSAFSLMRVPLTCPDRFIGTVESLEDIPNETSKFRTQVKVEIRAEEFIAGNVEDTEFIQVLKYGPIQIQEGERVEVHLRNKKVCYFKVQ